MTTYDQACGLIFPNVKLEIAKKLSAPESMILL